MTTNGPLAPSRTSSGCRRPATRTRRSPTTSATAAPTPTSGPSSTRASSSYARLGVLPADRRRHRALARRRRPGHPASSRAGHRLLPLRHATPGHRGRLRRLQRRRPDRLRRRRASRGPGPAAPGPEQGVRAPVAGAVRRAGRARRSRPATERPAVGAAGATMADTASGVGLIPEQAWENAGPRRRRRTAPTRQCASIGFAERQGGRQRLAADLVGGAVRAAVARPARGPDHRAAASTPSPATSATPSSGITVTLTAPADRSVVGATTTVTGTHGTRIDRSTSTP